MPWWALLQYDCVVGVWLSVTRIGQQSWSVTRLVSRRSRSGWGPPLWWSWALQVSWVCWWPCWPWRQVSSLPCVKRAPTTRPLSCAAGAQTEINSVVDHNTAVIVSQAAQVLHNPAGQPIASSELVVITSLPKKSDGVDSNVEVRGVGERAWEVRPNIKIIAGRKFTLGLRELIAGKKAVEQFKGLDLGASLKLNGQVWTFVGEFDSGDAHDSEVWGDAGVVASTYRRGNSTTSVSLRLTAPGQFEAFKAALSTDPRIKVDVDTTRNYYNKQSENLTQAIRLLGITVGTIMAVGAIFGALNTMYAAVATRAREIATLRAIGFRGVPVIVSVLLETMLLAVLGGALGAGLAWAVFDDYTASTLGNNFSQIVFAFNVTPQLLWRVSSGRWPSASSADCFRPCARPACL